MTPAHAPTDPARDPSGLTFLTMSTKPRFRADFTPDEELAAERVLVGRVKQLAYSDPSGTRVLEVFRIPEVQAKYPELMRRINENGPASVMRAAAERVLRDNPDKQILHTCAKCGELCLTPRAQQCFACGFDWHPKQGE